MNDAVSLADGNLFRVGAALELDGRLTWYPRGARGYAPANAYLLLDGTSALVVDTGLPAFEESVVRGLREMMPAGVDVSLLVTRAAESRLDRQRGSDSRGVSGAPCPCAMDLFRTIAFQPRFQLPEAGTDASWPEDPAVEWSNFVAGNPIEWTPGRTMELVRTPLRLLTTVWPYDAATSTLFTSDTFNYVVRSSPADSPVLREQDVDTTTLDDVVDHLAHGKFDWLAMADTSRIRKGVDDIFASRAVTRIAPSHGCLLEGRAVVERHVALLLEALDRISVSTTAVSV